METLYQKDTERLTNRGTRKCGTLQLATFFCGRPVVHNTYLEHEKNIFFRKHPFDSIVD